MPNASNSLSVTFPCATSVALAHKELAPFGEIAKLEVPPARQCSAVVSYYDTRAAERAVASLGSRAEKAPQYGDRSITLPGDAMIESLLAQEELSSVRQGSDGNYTLDFFDTRVAERVLSMAPLEPLEERASAEEVVAVSALVTLQVWNGERWKNEVHIVGPNPQLQVEKRQAEYSGAAHARKAVPRELPQRVLTPWSCSIPKCHNRMRLADMSWTDLANGREVRTTLRLRFLPAEMCSKDAFQRMLFTAGLAEMTNCVRIFLPNAIKRGGLGVGSATTDSIGSTCSAKRCSGSALVNAVDSKAALAIAQYFHGRQWAGSPLPVAVSFADVQGIAEVESRYPLDGPDSESSQAKLWRNESLGLVESFKLSAKARSGLGDDSSRGHGPQSPSFFPMGSDAKHPWVEFVPAATTVVN